MTNQNDFIRQASLFTMSGLADPRFMPDDNKESVTKKQTSSKETEQSSLFERALSKLFNRSVAR